MTAKATPSRQRQSSARLRRHDGEDPFSEHLDELVSQPRGLVPGAVGLGDDHEPGSGRHAPRERAAGRGQRAAVQVLERRRDEAGADHALDRLAARRRPVVNAHHGVRRLGRRHQPQPGGRDDAERPLGADQQALQVVPGDVLAHRAAHRDHLARRDDRLETGHPAARDAVLERVRAACVRGDVAADLGLLRRAGIGREEQAALARQQLDALRAHARLDVHPPQQRLEGAHAAEAVEREDDASFDRHRATGEARAAAARGQGHVVLVAPAEHAGDLVGRAREDDCVGAALDAARLGRVPAPDRIRAVQDGLVPEQRGELATRRRHRRLRLRRLRPRRSCPRSPNSSSSSTTSSSSKPA